MTKKVQQTLDTSDKLELYAALDVVERCVKRLTNSPAKTELMDLTLRFRAHCVKMLAEQATTISDPCAEGEG